MIINKYLTEQEFNDLIIKDKRILISNRKVGEIGDTINAISKYYKINYIQKCHVSGVSAIYFYVLGYTSPQECIEDWIIKNKLNKQSSYLYIHYFNVYDIRLKKSRK